MLADGLARTTAAGDMAIDMQACPRRTLDPPADLQGWADSIPGMLVRFVLFRHAGPRISDDHSPGFPPRQKPTHPGALHAFAAVKPAAVGRPRPRPEVLRGIDHRVLLLLLFPSSFFLLFLFENPKRATRSHGPGRVPGYDPAWHAHVTVGSGPENAEISGPRGAFQGSVLRVQ